MEKKKREVYKGLDIPDWYLKLEPDLLEKMAAYQKADKELKSLKQSIMTLMEHDKIDRIDSNLCQVGICRNGVSVTFDKAQLKADMPDVYTKYVKQSQKVPYLTIKLT